MDFDDDFDSLAESAIDRADLARKQEKGE